MSNFKSDLPRSKPLALIFFATFSLVIIPSSPAFAEVLDKLPMQKELWTWSLVAAGAGFLICRRWPKGLIGVLPVSLLYPTATLLEISDPFIYSALRAEVGWKYEVSVVLSMVNIVIFQSIGAFTGQSRQNETIANSPGEAR